MGDQGTIDHLKGLLAKARPPTPRRCFPRDIEAANDPSIPHQTSVSAAVMHAGRRAAPLSLAFAHFWVEDRWQTAIVWLVVLWPYAKKRWRQGWGWQVQNSSKTPPDGCKTSHKNHASTDFRCNGWLSSSKWRLDCSETAPRLDFPPLYPMSSWLIPLPDPVQYS